MLSNRIARAIFVFTDPTDTSLRRDAAAAAADNTARVVTGVLGVVVVDECILYIVYEYAGTAALRQTTTGDRLCDNMIWQASIFIFIESVITHRNGRSASIDFIICVDFGWHVPFHRVTKVYKAHHNLYARQHSPTRLWF